MLRVGLTGGIGSGKSTAARRLGELGATIVDADRIDLLVPSMVAVHVRERIEIDAAELLR